MASRRVAYERGIVFVCVCVRNSENGPPFGREREREEERKKERKREKARRVYKLNDFEDAKTRKRKRSERGEEERGNEKEIGRPEDGMEDEWSGAEQRGKIER